MFETQKKKHTKRTELHESKRTAEDGSQESSTERMPAAPGQAHSSGHPAAGSLAEAAC